MALTKTDKKEVARIARSEIRDMIDKEIADWMKKYHRHLYTKSEMWKRLK